MVDLLITLWSYSHCNGSFCMTIIMLNHLHQLQAGGPFSIDSTTGAISLTSSLDFMAQSSYMVEVDAVVSCIALVVNRFRVETAWEKRFFIALHV